MNSGARTGSFNAANKKAFIHILSVRLLSMQTFRGGPVPPEFTSEVLYAAYKIADPGIPLALPAAVNEFIAWQYSVWQKQPPNDMRPEWVYYSDPAAMGIDDEFMCSAR